MALKVVTLEELKAQMREDFDGEDDLIRLYGEAAEDEGGEGVPSRLKVAILMLAAHSHRNREPVAAVAQNAVPYAFDMYIKPYVKLSEREV